VYEGTVLCTTRIPHQSIVALLLSFYIFEREVWSEFFFLVSPKELQNLALTNFLLFVFQSLMMPHDKAKFLC